MESICSKEYRNGKATISRYNAIFYYHGQVYATKP